MTSPERLQELLIDVLEEGDVRDVFIDVNARHEDVEITGVRSLEAAGALTSSAGFELRLSDGSAFYLKIEQRR